MMLEVVDLVHRFMPRLLTSRRPSVACVCTTSAKYLVFDRDATRPACVVEVGDGERLRRVDRILAALERTLPGGAPRTFVCEPWRDGLYVHIQEGLPGVPWFRLADSCRTAEDWRHLLRRAVGAMFRLHGAIGRVPAWRSRVRVPAELARQVRLLDASGVALPAGLRPLVLDVSRAFEPLAPMSAVWQHGDFSLNNLLISNTNLSIIDFEDFGATLVPLHDAFGLALSVCLSQNGRSLLSNAECIEACVGPSLSNGLVARQHLPALLLHHLLWRINQCAGIERRAPLRRVLLTWVEELASRPALFLGGLASEPTMRI